MAWLVIAIACYLIGSFPSGYLVARSQGIDIREHGSKNIGATNVLRVMGKKWGYLVFFCDSLKGFLSVKTGAWLAAYFSGDPTLGAVIGGVACILGHNFPVWLRFKGGKGIATSSGVVLALFPIWLILGLAVLWVAIFLIGRFVSLASIAAAIAFPIGVFFVTPKAVQTSGFLLASLY